MSEQLPSQKLENPSRRSFLLRGRPDEALAEDSALLERDRQDGVTRDQLKIDVVREKLRQLPRAELIPHLLDSRETSVATEKTKQASFSQKRRGILRFLGGIGAATLLPGFAQAALLGRSEKSETHSESRTTGKTQEHREAERRVEVIPEYERTMERVLLTVPSEKDAEAFKRYLEEIYPELLMNLPDYSKIEIMLDTESVPIAKEFFREQGFEGRVTFLAGEAAPVTKHWGQDYGEMVMINGEERFLVAQKNDKEEFQEWYSAAAAERLGAKVERASFYFEGGNLSFDQTEKGLRVFIGYDDVAKSLGSPEKIEPEQIASVKEKIARTFGAAEVVVMGDEAQDRAVFHIDHSFVVLAGKVIVANEMSAESNRTSTLKRVDKIFLGDPEKSVELHKGYIEQLRGLGYTVKTIKHSREDREERKFSANAIPFIDKTTGQRKIFFPVYPGEVNGEFDMPGKLRAEQLTGKAQAAYKTYQDAGYLPIPVRDKVLHKEYGSLHCLTNVLS